MPANGSYFIFNDVFRLNYGWILLKVVSIINFITLTVFPSIKKSSPFALKVVIVIGFILIPRSMEEFKHQVGCLSRATASTCAKHPLLRGAGSALASRDPVRFGEFVCRQGSARTKKGKGLFPLGRKLFTHRVPRYSQGKKAVEWETKYVWVLTALLR